ncbi:MAG: hypothetical protein ACLP5J_08970 [Mycobacterium sp.]|uniref:hypothetical protein n=1 Tax=Mycobacterium sp. TaxID=1785 RepID=UPI003F9D35FF
MRHRTGKIVPPRELEDFALWCVYRGEFGDHVYTGDRGLWIEARRGWAEVHGWPGGESVMLAGEVIVADEPWEPEFPHGGLWERPTLDDGLGVRCAAHNLRPDEH